MGLLREPGKSVAVRDQSDRDIFHQRFRPGAGLQMLRELFREAPRNVRLQNVTGEVLQAPPLRSGLQMVPLPAGALLTLEWA